MCPGSPPTPTRHLCLTDLARMGWELHAIATFAGHRSTDSTLRYIHLSGRELSDKLGRGMSQIHAWRINLLTESGTDTDGDAWSASTFEASVGIAIGRRWVMLDPTGHDCSPRLTDDELNVLLTLGDVGVRRSRARGAEQRKPLWAMLGRLVRPLDDALSTLDHPAGARHRRAGLHAAGLVLSHCATTERSYWGWTSKDWEQLLGPSVEKFLAVRTLPTETTVRPFLVALACLFDGFDQFQRLGTFNRLTSRPARLRDRGHRNLARGGVRGARPVGLSGFPRGQAPAPRHPQSGIAGQQEPFAGGSPHGVFARLREHPATGAYQLPVLFAFQRAVAALGHCDPPVRTGHNAAPIIEGVDPLWAEWIERWYATSTLTPKVRAIIRTIMAKAGRWLVVEHPEITQPSEWSRQTCAAWVAAVDRMAVGDYVQRRDALAGRSGTPISPPPRPISSWPAARSSGTVRSGSGSLVASTPRVPSRCHAVSLPLSGPIHG